MTCCDNRLPAGQRIPAVFEQFNKRPIGNRLLQRVFVDHSLIAHTLFTSFLLKFDRRKFRLLSALDVPDKNLRVKTEMLRADKRDSMSRQGSLDA